MSADLHNEEVIAYCTESAEKQPDCCVLKTKCERWNQSGEINNLSLRKGYDKKSDNQKPLTK